MEKIVLFSGAGISAESGLKTFRDPDGLWKRYSLEDLATPGAWSRNPSLVLEFYNARRRQLGEVEPNAAHRAVAELEEQFAVTVVTQNVDDLHERAGSTNVVHLHGQLNQARSTMDSDLILDLGFRDIVLGDLCPKGSQLRPNIVWFGENVNNLEVAAAAIEAADKVLVVGTSLSVYPAAGLIHHASAQAEKVMVSMDLDSEPQRFTWLQGKAAELVPAVVETWLSGG